MLHSYEVHGLKFRSEIPLGRSSEFSGQPDFVVRLAAPGIVPPEAPAGRILSQVFNGKNVLRTHCRDDSGYTLRYHGLCEFRIRDGHIEVQPDPRVDPGFAAILLASGVPSVLLTIAGKCVLHASAVERDGEAIAFVGTSGMGKSTLAGLCCAAGARLISDDVLRVEPVGVNGHDVPDRPGGPGRSPGAPGARGETWRCFPGTSELRLRASASPLAERFPAGAVAVTADERLCLDVGEGSFVPSASRPILRALLLPQPSREWPRLELEQLSPAETLHRLLRFPRVIGWQDEALIRGQFELFARLARSVPAYKARIPWEDRPSPALAEELMRLVKPGQMATAAS